jgi:hypothetical protein
VSKSFMLVAATLLAGVAAVMTQSAVAQEIAGLDTAGIKRASGFKGQVIAEEKVFKIGKSRTDVKVAVYQRTMPPFMDRNRGQILGSFQNVNS